MPRAYHWANRMNSVDFTLYLVRHAQSANNANPESQRVPDPAITPLGIQQAQALAGVAGDLDPSHLFCSPFLRTLQTSAPLADALGLTPVIRADLYEQGGCYRGYRLDDRTPEPGLSRSELKSLHPTWHIDSVIDDSGWNKHSVYEGLEEARARARRVSGWLSGHPWALNSRIMLVIHADFKIRMLEALLGDLDIEGRLGSVVNTAWTTLSCSQGRWELHDFNAHPHLEAHMVSC